MAAPGVVPALVIAGTLWCCSNVPAPLPGLTEVHDATVDAGSSHAPLLDCPDFERWNPQFYRLSEESLSGLWRFTFDPDESGLQRSLQSFAGYANYDREILVPFPWQSVLSGVGPEPPAQFARFGSEQELHSYSGTVWYARTVSPPPDWSTAGHWVVRFGASDWETTVFVDGTEVGHHVGGYDPFEIIIPESSRSASFYIAVKVVDPCAGDSVVGGKQGGLWYTCAGGLWQDVTLYRRPVAHVQHIHEAIAEDGKTLETVVHLSTSAPGALRATYGCPEYQCLPVTVEATVSAGQGSADVPLSVPLASFPSWSPEHPVLLPRTVEFCVELNCDTVYGYAAARPWTVDWVTDQFQGFFVDDEPFYVRGILDQGYHPLGIVQYPTRAARIDELARLKALGFNTIRQHIKPEPPWFYAACDALGLAVIYDMPCPYDVSASPPNAPWAHPWETMVETLVLRDINHPSILFWVNFNEAWGLLNPPFWQSEAGLDYVASQAQWVRSLDPSRPVEDHSPGGFSEFLDNGALPHVDTDINSFHLYDRSVSSFATRVANHLAGIFPGSSAHFYGESQRGQPLLVSEFGGLSADDTRGDSTYALHGQLNVLRAHALIQGFVYTQAYDVEWERNGLWTYARESKETGLEHLGLSLVDLLGPNYVALGEEPAILIAREEPLSLNVVTQVFAQGPADNLTWTLQNEEDLTVAEGSIDVANFPEPHAFPLDVGTIAIPGIYRLGATLLGDSMLLARNGAYVVVNPDEPPAHPLDETTLADTGNADCNPGACWCPGACSLSYALPELPPGAQSLSLGLEVSTYDVQEPQTDDLQLPGKVSIRVGELLICEIEVPDAPADHRGVLSHLLTPALRGAYGYQHHCTITAAQLGQGADTVTISSDNGLRIFTPAGGRFLQASTFSLP